MTWHVPRRCICPWSPAVRLCSATGVLKFLDPVLCIIVLVFLTVGRSDRLILELQIASSTIRGVDPCLGLGNPWGWNGIRGRDEKWNQLDTRSTHGDHGTELKPSPVSGAPGVLVPVPVPCMRCLWLSPAAPRPSSQRLFADDDDASRYLVRWCLACIMHSSRMPLPPLQVLSHLPSRFVFVMGVT